MTKSRRFSRSLASRALSLVLLVSLAAGCSTSTTPTYASRDIDKTVEKILRDEYKMKARSRLVGGALWVYVPVDELFERTKGNDPADKIRERFEIQENESVLREGLLRVSYLVKPIVPEREKDQGYKISKKAMEKINNAWEVVRRVLFSMSARDREQVQFYVLMAADVSNGLEIRETIYYKDLIKVLYRVISPGEYHHRVAVKSGLRPEVIGDWEGNSVKYADVKFKDFLCNQIEHRVGLKFQKPEVEQSADADKEVRKVVLEVLTIYGFTDFTVAELTNLLTNSKCHLDPGDVRDLNPKLVPVLKK